MIVYRKNPEGRADQLRFAPPGYVPEPDELELPGDVLPPIETLHDPAYALADARRAAMRAVNEAAEAARLRTITPGAGQAATYLLKEADARAYAAAGYPSAQLAQYLFIDAERQAAGQTGRQAADWIIATADAWRAKAAQIDGARRAGLLAVEAAADVPEIATARDAALAALAAL